MTANCPKKPPEITFNDYLYLGPNLKVTKAYKTNKSREWFVQFLSHFALISWPFAQIPNKLLAIPTTSVEMAGKRASPEMVSEKKKA